MEPLKLLLFASCALMLCLARAGPAGAFDHAYATYGWWEVGYNNEGPVGCTAFATFEGGTSVRITLNSDKAWLYFFNRSWTFIKEDQSYKMKLVFSSRDTWTGSLIGLDLGDRIFGVHTEVSIEFLKDFANFSGMRIYLAGRDVAYLSLSGTKAALLSTIDCLKAREKGGQVATNNRADEEDAKGGSGTGIIISREGHILTNYHVVKGCTSIKVTQKADFAKPAPVLRYDSTNDLALLKLSSSDLSGDVATFRAGPAVRAGEVVAIYGFPLVGALSVTGNIVSGNVTSLSGLSDDVRYLQVSAPVQPGNSGGPLLDESGLVIGVVTARINDVAVAQATGALPQNVNFAIKGSVASSFLEAHSIPLEMAPKGAPKGLPDIGEAAKKFTVLVTCE